MCVGVCADSCVVLYKRFFFPTTNPVPQNRAPARSLTRTNPISTPNNNTEISAQCLFTNEFLNTQIDLVFFFYFNYDFLLHYSKDSTSIGRLQCTFWLPKGARARGRSEPVHCYKAPDRPTPPLRADWELDETQFRVD